MTKILLILFFVIVSLNSYSQIPIGVKAGMTANEIVFRETERVPQYVDYHLASSLHVGLYSKVKIREELYFYPEIQYIEKRSSYQYLSDYDKSGEIKLSYIESPLVLSYQTTRWLALDFGGSIGVNLRDNSFFENFSKLDAGIIAGPRVDLPENFSILLRYYYGLSSIGYFARDTFTRQIDKVGKAYNQNLQVSFAYRFL